MTELRLLLSLWYPVGLLGSFIWLYRTPYFERDNLSDWIFVFGMAFVGPFNLVSAAIYRLMLTEEKTLGFRQR